MEICGRSQKTDSDIHLRACRLLCRLFPRAMSRVNMPACAYGECCEGQRPRYYATLQV